MHWHCTDAYLQLAPQFLGFLWAWAMTSLSLNQQGLRTTVHHKSSRPQAGPRHPSLLFLWPSQTKLLTSPAFPVSDTFLLLRTWSTVLYSSCLPGRLKGCNSSWPPLRPKMPNTCPVHLAETRGSVTLLESGGLGLCFFVFCPCTYWVDKTFSLH